MTDISSIDAVQKMLGDQGYICGRDLGTVVFLSLALGRPLFLEGEAGVGKTEIAKALAAGLNRQTDPPAMLRRAWMPPPPCMNGIFRPRWSPSAPPKRQERAQNGPARPDTDLFSDEFPDRTPLAGGDAAG